MIRLHLTILFLVLVFNIFPQQLNEKQKIAIQTVIEKQFGSAAAKLDLLKYNTFVTIKSDTFFNPGGYFYLFKLKGDSLERIDRSFFHGTTFNRFLFSWDDQIFQLGGYGMFMTNNLLLRFSYTGKDWQAVRTKGEKPLFLNGVTFFSGDSIITFSNYKNGNLVETNFYDSALYVLRLKNFQWKKYLINKELNGWAINYETDDYIICSLETRILLIKKSNLTYIILNNIGDSFMRHPAEYGIKNTVFFNNEVSLSYSLNLDSLSKKYTGKFVPILEMKKQYLHEKTNSFWFLLLLPAFVFLFLYQRKKRRLNLLTEGSENSQSVLNNHLSQTNGFYDALMRQEKKLLTMEELDILLEIEHMESDSKKLRRFRIIQNLNDRYPGFITRVKDLNDKRRFLYQLKRS
jgi:hypothetical protein